MRFAQIVDSVKSLQEFIEINKVIPNEIIVVWDEPYGDDENEPNK